MLALQAAQGFKRVVYSVQGSLICGNEVESVAVLRLGTRQRFSGGESLGMATGFA